MLLVGVGAYMFAPRDADLARAIAGRGGSADSIEVGMLDEDAAREIMAELDRQDEERKAEEAKKEENSLKAPGQVVDLPTPREEKRPDDAQLRLRARQLGRARDARSTAASRTTRARAIRTARRRCRGPATPVRRRAAGDANARSREIPARSRGAGAGGARRDGRAARTARPIPGHLEQGGAIPELGADARC